MADYIEPTPGSTNANNNRPRNSIQTYNLTDAHEVYIDGILLPQTPSKITYEYPDETEVVRLANQENYTIPKHDSPIKISFDFVCSTEKYPFTWDTDYDRKRWTDYLWTIKQERRPVNFAVWRYHDSKNQSGTFNVAMKMLVTDWSFVEDAEQDSDFIISITLLQYFEQRNLEIDTDIQHHLIANRRARGWAATGRGQG